MEKERKLFTVLIDKKSFEVLNSEFTKAKCYIMYHGDNRNGNSMSKETVEAAIPSLYNIPVVGEFKEEVKDFGTHGGKIEISDEGIKYIETTKPFGLVPESCDPRWETVKEEDGTEHEYLVADLILWSARYPELQATLDSYSNESMEIMVMDADVRKDGIYNIKQFQFSALCLLGKQTEPCFENSRIVAYAIEEFKNELNELMQSYTKFACDKDKEEMEKETEPEAEADEETEEDFTQEFSATYRQKREALDNALDPIIVRDEKGNCISETYFWVHDFSDSHVMVERNIWTRNDSDRQYGRFTYSFNDEDLSAKITSEFEKMITEVWLTEAEYQIILDSRKQKDDEYSALKSENESLKSQNAELQVYKKANEFEQNKVEIDSLVETFELELSESSEFITLKENIKSAFEKNEILIDYDSLNKELFAMVGRKKFTVVPKKVVSRVAIIPDKTDKKSDKAEFGAAEKWFKNVNDD
jgi:small-conductance mechanosensitive channel